MESYGHLRRVGLPSWAFTWHRVSSPSIAFTVVPRCSPLDLVRLWCVGRVLARCRRLVCSPVQIGAETLLGSFKAWALVGHKEDPDFRAAPIDPICSKGQLCMGSFVS
ncbi:hypothetical protein GCM10010350_76970 [Streptomyces galilaeus]|nr:hypothetical protein GCM10010350_76970 [Streptomyces galilaeus]